MFVAVTRLRLRASHRCLFGRRVFVMLCRSRSRWHISWPAVSQAAGRVHGCIRFVCDPLHCIVTVVIVVVACRRRRSSVFVWWPVALRLCRPGCVCCIVVVFVLTALQFAGDGRWR